MVIIFESLLRNIPNDYSFKKKYLDKNSNQIEYLFLGSSHTFYGINPTFIDGKAFNAAHISQTIDYDYEILMKYKSDFKSLKIIFLPIDYLTLFSRVKAGKESWRVKNYQIYYQIFKTFNIEKNTELFSFSIKRNINRIKNYYYWGKNQLTCDSLGFGNNIKEQSDLFTSGINNAKRHTKKDTSFYTPNKVLVKSILNYAYDNNARVILYSNPVFHTYSENLDSTQLDLIMRFINDLQIQYLDLNYYDFSTDKFFTADDFRDADHLNHNGAERLSKIFNNIILEK